MTSGPWALCFCLVRYGQDASGDGVVRGRVPAETASAVHDGGGTGE